MTPLIDLFLVHVLNNSHPHAVADICEGEEVETLREVYILNIKRREAELMSAMSKLLEAYTHAHYLALQHRHNPEVNDLLREAGVETED